MEEQNQARPELVVMLALAMEVMRAARLEANLEAERRQRRLAETLREVSSALNASLELPQVLDQVLTSLQRVVHYDSASVLLLEDNTLHFVAAHGHPDTAHVLSLKISASRDPLFQEIISTRRPILLPDAPSDPRWDKYSEESYIRGWIGVPMILRDKVIGMLTVDSRERNAYNAKDAELAFTFADQAVIAIENARLYAEAQHLAITDGLTNLFNRRHFYQLAEHEFQRSRRYQRPLSVLMLDVDFFKEINDRYGHLIGDEVLQQLAERARQNLREIDVLARYGGEEFAVLLPETDHAAARDAAERLSRRIAQEPFETQGSAIKITISIGLATLDADIGDVAALVDAADRALYMAKNAGRNRVEG